MSDWLKLLKPKPTIPDALGPKPDKKPPEALVDLQEYDKFRKSLFKEVDTLTNKENKK